MKMKILRYLLLGIGFLILAFPVLSQTTTQGGIELYRTAKYDEAVTALKSITDSDKKDRFAWIYLGASLMKAGHGKDAAAAFRKGNVKVEDLVPGDDAPVTKFSKPRPHYTDMARQSLTVGIVRVAVELKSDGKIGFIVPVDTLPKKTRLSMSRAIRFATTHRFAIISSSLLNGSWGKTLMTLARSALCLSPPMNCLQALRDCASRHGSMA